MGALHTRNSSPLHTCGRYDIVCRVGIMLRPGSSTTFGFRSGNTPLLCALGATILYELLTRFGGTISAYSLVTAHYVRYNAVDPTRNQSCEQERCHDHRR